MPIGSVRSELALLLHRLRVLLGLVALMMAAVALSVGLFAVLVAAALAPMVPR